MTLRQHNRGYVLISVLVALLLLAAISVLINRESVMGVNRVSAQAQQSQAGYIAEAGLHHARWQANNASCEDYSLPVTPFAGGSYAVTYAPTDGSPVSIAVQGSLGGATASAQLNQHTPVYDGINTLEIRGDEGSGKDTYLSQWWPGRNYGASNYMEVSGVVSSFAHGLLQFDLTPLQGAQIFSAELQLNANNNSWAPTTLNVHRITTEWEEGDESNGNGQANWSEAKTGVNWSVAGGDVDPRVYASAQTSGTFGWVNWDVTALVREWVTGVQPNYGLMLRAAVLGEGAEFDSGNASGSSNRPRLVVRYGCECGQVCGAGGPGNCEADYTPGTEVQQFDTSGYGSTAGQALVYLPAGIEFNDTVAPAEGAWLNLDSTDARVYMLDMNGNLLTDRAHDGSYHGMAYIEAGSFANSLVFSTTGTSLVFMDMDLGSPIALPVANVTQISAVGYIGITQSGSYDEHLAVLDRSAEKIVVITQLGSEATNFSVNDGLGSNVQGVTHLPGSDKLLITYDDHASIYDLNGNLLRDYSLGDFGTNLAEHVAIHPGTCQHVLLDKGNHVVKYLEPGPLSCDPDYSADTQVAKHDFATAGIIDVRGMAYAPEGTLLSGTAAPAEGAWLVLEVGDANVVHMMSMGWTELANCSHGYVDATGLTLVQGGPKAGQLAIVDALQRDVHFMDENCTLQSTVDFGGVGLLPNGISYIDTDSAGLYPDHLAVAESNESSIHIIDQSGVEKLQIDTSVFNTRLSGISHIAGTDKFLLVDHNSNSVGVIDIGGNLIRSYDVSTLNPVTHGLAYNPLTCDHALASPFTDALVLLNQGGGGGPPGATSCAQGGTLREQFDTRAFDNSDGTLDWSASPWIEIGESDGVSSGDIAFWNDDSNYQLRTRDNDNGGEGLEREADLSGAASATLSYIYRRDNLDNSNDYTKVEISANGAAGPWVELARYQGAGEDVSYQSASHDISAYISTNTRIRFITSANMGGQDVVWFDDVEVQCAP